MAEIHFWYEFASTYSYPAAMRIEALAAQRNVQVHWHPFLLGPIFAEQGWTSSPFNIYPAQGRYMWRDLQRLCAIHGLVFHRPDPFPQNGVLASRVALALPGEKKPPFTRAVFHAQFAERKVIAEPDVIGNILEALGEDPAAVVAKAQDEVHRGQLRAQTDAARNLGIFGAPSLITKDGELFWGDDRLQQALDWAVNQG